VIILKGSIEIKNVNITDPGITSLSVGDLERDTEYNVKVLARNLVFEGPAVEKAVKTKYEGNKTWNLVPSYFLIEGLSIVVQSYSHKVNHFKHEMSDIFR